jgi:hypothetical protein
MRPKLTQIQSCDQHKNKSEGAEVSDSAIVTTLTHALPEFPPALLPHVSFMAGIDLLFSGERIRPYES